MSAVPSKRRANVEASDGPGPSAKIPRLEADIGDSTNVVSSNESPVRPQGDCQLPPDNFRINVHSPCNSHTATKRSALAATGKREDYLSWSEYFMAVAFLSAQRSKDPNSQVGACIVNGEKKIVGIGYNGMPNGCSDDQLPWARTAEDKLDTKYPYVCHAEMNAILNKNSADVKGCTIYIALFPCNECAKLIIQSGIKEVVYMSDKYSDRPEFQASRRLLNMAKVTCSQFTPKNRQIVVDFNSI